MRSHWLFSCRSDLTILFIPVWLTWVVVFSVPNHLLHQEIAPWVLLIFVLGIDVGHVWSTMFRTYLDKEEFSNHKYLLISAPIVSFALSFCIAFISIDLFWRCLVYVAVFHFVKQQYGFMRIYKAKSRDFQKKIISDNLTIYASMLLPILYWHLNLDRDFEWFSEGDFIQFHLAPDLSHYFNNFIKGLYFLIIGGWLLEEVYRRIAYGHSLAVGKILWILTTAGNWYIGIVHFNSDLAYTLTNVVAHGLPYFALVIFYTDRKKNLKDNSNSTKISLQIVYTILLVVLGLALFEEFLWDQLVYQEEGGLFHSIFGISFTDTSSFIKVLAIASLSVPQITHYIVDGFIWKSNDKNPYVKPILLGE